MQEQLLKEYASIEEQVKELEIKKAELRGQILGSMKNEKLDKVESAYGSFTVAHRSTWQYSPAVEKKEEALKILKHKEQEKGIAKAVIGDYLVFKAVQ